MPTPNDNHFHYATLLDEVMVGTPGERDYFVWDVEKDMTTAGGVGFGQISTDLISGFDVGLDKICASRTRTNLLAWSNLEE